MRFGIDLDGVMFDFGARVVEIGNRLWPGKFPKNYIPDNWNYEGYLTDAEWKRIWAEIENTPHFWLDEKPLEGVVHLRCWLDRRQHICQDEVYFITARRKTCGDGPLSQTCKALQAWKLYPREGNSVVLAVEDASEKQHLFKGLKIKYMLDDYAPTIKDLLEAGVQAYVLDQPWNRYMAELPRVYSVAQYLDTIAYIERYGFKPEHVAR